MSALARVKRRLRRGVILRQRAMSANNPAQRELDRCLEEADTILDLGCGAHPVAGATAAVDLFLDARQRGAGRGAAIDPAAIAARGIRFESQSIDEPLPFARGEFDFAHSSHVIEHVERPGAACDEMMRVARAGLLRCPAALIEFATGRSYHRWLVLHRGPRVIFIEKRACDYAVFGEGAHNPFEALIDWEGAGARTPSSGAVGALKRRLQRLFYGRAPQIEVNLFWRGGFLWSEVRADGSLASGGRAGECWWFDEAGARHGAKP